MFCRSKSRDPLVRYLFEKQDLSILSVALTPDELSPGKVIRTFPKSANRSPCVDSADHLFEPAPRLDEVTRPYVGINSGIRSRKISAKVLANLASSLGAGQLDHAQVAAAFSRATSRQYQICLTGAVRRDIVESDLERLIAGTKLTAFGQACLANENRFFAVTRTVLASKVRITGADDLTTTAEALAKIPAIADAKFAVNLVDQMRSAIEMGPVGSAMVIGFRAIEIVPQGDVMALRGATEPLPLRDDRKRTAAAVDDFTESGVVFTNIEVSETLK